MRRPMATMIKKYRKRTRQSIASFAFIQSLGDRISGTRKVDRALRRAMLKNSIEVRAGLARLLDPPMDLTRIEAPDFDLAMTLNSGQGFHWEKIGDGFYGMVGVRAVYVEHRGVILKVRFGERSKPAVETRARP